MAHKEFKSLYASNNKHLLNIAPQLLTNWVQLDIESDEHMLHDSESDPSSCSTTYRPMTQHCGHLTSPLICS